LNSFSTSGSEVTLIGLSVNSGQSVCRNIGIAKAKTEILMFFDDDDYSLSSRSLVHCELFKEGAKASFVSSVKKYSDGKEIAYINANWVGMVQTWDLSKCLLLGKQLKQGFVAIPASTACVDKFTVLSAGGFDSLLRRLEDVDLFLRMSQNRIVMGWSNEIGVIRNATESLDKGRGIDMIYEQQVLERHKTFLTDKEFKYALIHCEARRLYFSSEILKLIVYLISHPLYVAQRVMNPKPALRRMKHDLRRHKGRR